MRSKSIKVNPKTVASTPEYSLLKTLFKEKGTLLLWNFEKQGINAGTLSDQVRYDSPNLRSRNRSSANIILS